MGKDNKNILIFSAIQLEARGIINRLRLKRDGNIDGLKVYSSESADQRINLVITGVGMRKSAFAAECSIAHFKPDVVFNFGLAGSLDNRLNPGQLIIPEALRDIDGQSLKPDQAIVSNWREIIGEIDNAKYNLISLYRPVNKSAVRNHLNLTQNVHSVDMEAFEQLKISAEAGIPFACMKIISDGAGFFSILQYWKDMMKMSNVLGETVEKILCDDE